MNTLNDLLLEYVEIIDTMSKLHNTTGTTLYGLDNRRTKIHEKIINQLPDNFDPYRVKQIFSNLEMLLEIRIEPPIFPLHKTLHSTTVANIIEKLLYGEWRHYLTHHTDRLKKPFRNEWIVDVNKKDREIK